MTLAVTGASGFVGRHLVAHLARLGIEARAVSRRADGPLPEGIVPAVVPSFDNQRALEAACEGCSAVVHLAGRAHVMRDDARDPLGEFRRINVDATRSLLAAASRSGVNRFVFVSTIKVNGEGRAWPYRADDDAEPTDPYAVSKAEAEAVVREFAGELETVIVRPPLVYGPGVSGNFLRLLKMTDASRIVPLPFGGITNRRSFVFVGNLVDALVHLAHAPEAPGRAFVISDGEDLSTPELIRRLGRAAGFRPRLVAVPERLLRTVAQILYGGDAFRRLSTSLTVDPADLVATGWAPPYSVDEGLRLTVEWWTERRRA